MARLHSFRVRTVTGALIITIVGAIIFLALSKNIDAFNKILDKLEARNTTIQELQK